MCSSDLRPTVPAKPGSRSCMGFSGVLAHAAAVDPQPGDAGAGGTDEEFVRRVAVGVQSQVRPRRFVQAAGRRANVSRISLNMPV